MVDETKITGVIFSDLGRGASFMALDWVQQTVRERVGFRPYPGTLNLRLEDHKQVACWRNLRRALKGIDIPPSHASFCHARCYLARIGGIPRQGGGPMGVAVLRPEVKGYPPDKIEIIAPFHVKESLNVRDGDRITLEFTGE